jgi:hypothetical protein
VYHDSSVSLHRVIGSDRGASYKNAYFLFDRPFSFPYEGDNLTTTGGRFTIAGFSDACGSTFNTTGQFGMQPRDSGVYWQISRVNPAMWVNESQPANVSGFWAVNPPPIMSQLPVAVVMDGASNIVFRSISIQHASGKTACSGTLPCNSAGNAWAGTAAVIITNQSSAITLVDVELARNGAFGAIIANGSRGVTLDSCRVWDSGAGGIRIGAGTPQPGATAPPLPVSEVVINNTVIGIAGTTVPGAVGACDGRGGGGGVGGPEMCRAGAAPSAALQLRVGRPLPHGHQHPGPPALLVYVSLPVRLCGVPPHQCAPLLPPAP